MKFDAYAGNVWGGTPCSEVAEVIAISAHARVERGRPRGRYTDVFDVKDGADMIGWIGRDAMIDTAYFEFKGSCTPITAEAIRKHWPLRHTVSRADACEDLEHPDAFETVTRIFDAAKDPRVQSLIMAPRDGDRGRTIYWGSGQSRAKVRLYEAGKMKERLHYGRPNWVRPEGQFRPGKASEKLLASTLTPLDFWGLSAWTKRAAEALCQVEVPRFAPPSQPVDFDKTTLYVARAFRRHFAEMRGDFGSWECIGRELEAVWRADDEAAAALDALARTPRG